MHNAGDNLTLLNVEYERPHRTESGKLTKDYITLIYKNLDTNEKEHKTIYEPKYTYYMIKPGKEKKFSQFFVPIEDTNPVTVKYNSLLMDIAKKTGHLEDFYDNCKNGNARGNSILNTDPRILSSDITVESFYRMEFNRTYKNEVCPVDKCFLDIEVDTKPIGGVFPALGECPVNAVSILMEKTNTEYVLILKDPANPKSMVFEDYVNTHDFESDYRAFLDENLRGHKNVIRMGLDSIKFKIVFFSDEKKLIHTIFNLINAVQPDFVLAWNMAFDIPYLIERMKILNMDYVNILCHPDFEEKQAFYKVDTEHHVMAERGDYARISSYSVYLDQMIQFASRRKGQAAFENNTLDYIGEVVAGCKKLDYHDICENLSDLPYTDFIKFIMYNMTDVVVQWCIEHKTGDIDYVFNKSIINSTQFAKVHRQTVYLANRAAMIFRDAGFIIGNNVNKFMSYTKEQKEAMKYPGAYVAPPMLLGDTPKVKLCRDGLEPKAINIAKNGTDYDYKALYPSLMRENNIAPNTQIGMVDIPDKIYENENPFNLPLGIHKGQFNRAETFIENFASKNVLEFCKRWLSLAGYEEVLNDIEEYFSTREHTYIPMNRRLAEEGLNEVVQRTFKDEKLKVVQRIKEGNKLNVVNRYIGIPTKIKTKIKEHFDKENV